MTFLGLSCVCCIKITSAIAYNRYNLWNFVGLWSYVISSFECIRWSRSEVRTLCFAGPYARFDFMRVETINLSHSVEDAVSCAFGTWGFGWGEEEEEEGKVKGPKLNSEGISRRAVDWWGNSQGLRLHFPLMHGNFMSLSPPGKNRREQQNPCGFTPSLSHSTTVFAKSHLTF